jgi:hypothetical protein
MKSAVSMLCIAATQGCANLNSVFADVHDGDQKTVKLEGSFMSITPSGSDEKWLIEADFDCNTGSAVVEFNVPGKPSPPPVPLTASYWTHASAMQSKVVFEFTDPSGTLARPDFPLNQWVQLGDASASGINECPTSLEVVYADMHDGDKKRVVIDGSAMTITPYDNDQEWTVEAEVDAKSCSASVDFNVPGKVDHPPVPLQATFFLASKVTGESKTIFEFTDPSGTLADATMPLNHWVELPTSVIA